MAIDLACPKCHQKYRLKDELAGKKAKCAKCGESMQIPGAQPVAAGVASAPKASAAQATVSKPTAQKPAPAKPVSALTKPVIADPLPDLSDLFDDSFPVAAQPSRLESTSSGISCPKCGERLGDKAMVCIKCGYNKKTGKMMTTSHDSSAFTEKKKGSAGTLMKGTLFSFIGAMIGAGIWLAIIVFTGYEIGYVAWGLGAAAGVGMAAGHEDDDGTTAGIIAACMAIGGIFAAKFFAFEHIKNNFASYALDGEELEGVDAVQLAEVSQQLGNLFAQEMTFMSMFGPIDALFILFAVGTAYKLGSGQATS
jgi:DNA-directed RNA polymerase subunit M/transcription elongation factor TFIIS